jgi:predicted ATPase with chaperone activity
MPATAAPVSRFEPADAHTLEDTGLPPNLLLDLVLKHAYFEGTAALSKLAERTRLSPVVVHSIYRQLHKEHLCDTRARETSAVHDEDYQIALTARGRERAEIALRNCHYVGPAPVPLAEYNRAVIAQTMEVRVTAASLRAALSDLVVPDYVIRELGAALVTGGAIVLYGLTGNGKTSIAERLNRVSNDLIYVPYAVEAGGQIITVYDPLIHIPAEQQRENSSWVLCRRPLLKVGGELRADHLEVRVDETTRIGTAPIQMKANNGILLIDDFGRQRMTPRELLNRWIVPMDRGTDVLSLPSGASIEIPFQVLVVFATNLVLSSLAEEAFMRRLKNKIKIEPLSEGLFRELLRRAAAQRGIACSPKMEDFIVEECARNSPDGLRACYPADLMAIIEGISKFEQRTPVVEKAEVEYALMLYFVH